MGSSLRTNVQVKVSADSEQVANIPADVLINPKGAKKAIYQSLLNVNLLMILLMSIKGEKKKPLKCNS